MNSFSFAQILRTLSFITTYPDTSIDLYKLFIFKICYLNINNLVEVALSTIFF